jgi:two-component system, LytTR family, sensor kinase
VTRALRIQVAAASAFWAVVSVLYVLQNWMLSLQLGSRSPFTRATFIYTSIVYLVWIPFTVIIWRAGKNWTVDRLGWLGFLARHVALIVVIAAAHNAVMARASIALFKLPPNETFSEMFASGMRSRSYTELIMYAGVVAAGQAWRHYEQWRDRDAQAARLEAQLSAAKLSALEAQMQPHFLFNSLHTIASLARDGRSADVVRLIADLSELLRAVTDQQHSTRPLADEIALANRYLDIQQVRFGDRLRVAIDVPPGAERIAVPTLTLQPLIDNAIRHGLGNVVGGGTVSIRAAVDATSMTLTVDDDGEGPAAGWSLATSGGTGLSNLNSRLVILYNGRAELTAGRGPSGGFRVTVRVPAVTA